MAYKVPSRRHVKKEPERINLIPILDAVFIFIFFLLMSAQFVQIFEINSDVPIVSEGPPPEDEKNPLALTLRINDKGFELASGLPSQTLRAIPKNQDGLYDMNALHEFLVDLKKQHVKEQSIVFLPEVDLTYEEIVNIMDAVRMLRNTDDAIYVQDEEGVDVKVEELFNKIVFGNLMS